MGRRIFGTHNDGRDGVIRDHSSPLVVERLGEDQIEVSAPDDSGRPGVAICLRSVRLRRLTPSAADCLL